MNQGTSARSQKRSLRRSVVAHILGLDPRHRVAQDAALHAFFPQLEGFADAPTVLLYVNALPEEIDTSRFLSLALESGKHLVCPRVDREAGGLVLHRIEDPGRDLVPGAMGIPEPRRSGPLVDPLEIDWALIPGVAFNLRGYRLGRGAGFYDRLLPRLREGIMTWALAYDCQIVDALPVEAHDRPVQGIATPSGVFMASRSSS